MRLSVVFTYPLGDFRAFAVFFVPLPFPFLDFRLLIVFLVVCGGLCFDMREFGVYPSFCPDIRSLVVCTHVFPLICLAFGLVG